MMRVKEWGSGVRNKGGEERTSVGAEERTNGGFVGGEGCGGFFVIVEVVWASYRVGVLSCERV